MIIYLYIISCLLCFGWNIKNLIALWRQKDNSPLEKKSIKINFLVSIVMIVFSLYIFF